MLLEKTLNLGSPSGSGGKAEEGKFCPPLTRPQNSVSIHGLISQTKFEDATDSFMIPINFIGDTFGIEQHDAL